MTQEALNIAGQCRATASSPLAKNILVDEGNGLLTELLLDAARIIEALAQTQEPVMLSDYESNGIHHKPVAHLWECLGRWSSYLVNNGKQADCVPPQWLCDAVKNATTPQQRTEQNFCSRCGKRTADLTVIHTCTPPQD